MTALFRGGELEAFNLSGSGVAETTSSGRFNSSFARCAINLSGAGSSNPGSAYAETASWSAQTGDVYLHFDEIDLGVGVLGHTAVQLFSGSTANIRIWQTNASGARLWNVQYRNSSGVWTSVGSATLNAALADYDLYANITAGVIALYVRGNSSAAYAEGLSLGHMSGITKARLYSDFSGPRCVSQIMADTSPTMGWRLGTYYPTGAGSDSAWTGTYANVDEVSLSDVDSITSDTANQVFTCAVTGPAVPTGYSVRDVTVSHRSKEGATGPTKIEAALRSAGTNYFSADLAQTLAYAPHQNTWAANPATGAAFLSSEIAALQPGAKSIA